VSINNPCISFLHHIAYPLLLWVIFSWSYHCLVCLHAIPTQWWWLYHPDVRDHCTKEILFQISNGLRLVEYCCPSHVISIIWSSLSFGHRRCHCGRCLCHFCCCCHHVSIVFHAACHMSPSFLSSLLPSSFGRCHHTPLSFFILLFAAICHHVVICHLSLSVVYSHLSLSSSVVSLHRSLLSIMFLLADGILLFVVCCSVVCLLL